MPEPVTSGLQLWSEQVALAEAASGPPDPPVAYEFSNGRKFAPPQNPYATVPA